MRIHELDSTDAFIAFDLEDVPSYGITRLARKVLRDGAELLARSTTYAFATFELRHGGASAGINAQDGTRDEAVASFVDEVTPLVSKGRWATDPGLGVTEADLAPVRAVDPRPPALWEDGLHDELTAMGAVAAARGFRELSGARVVLDLPGDHLASAVRSAGAEVVATTTPTDRLDTITAACDVVFAGGRAGSIDHELAGRLDTGLVVPVAPTPVTAKALAVLTRAETVLVPDFVSTAAPLLAGFDLDAGDPVERVAAAAGDLGAHGTGAWMAAVERAESFLSSWQDELPFGRPLA